MEGCLKPPTTETKDEAEHGDATGNGYSDRGSTPLASTFLISKEVTQEYVDSKNTSKNACAHIRRRLWVSEFVHWHVLIGLNPERYFVYQRSFPRTRQPVIAAWTGLEEFR